MRQSHICKRGLARKVMRFFIYNQGSEYMITEWRITQKPDFFKALLALPPKETHQVLEKINLLAQDLTLATKVNWNLRG